MTSVSLRIAVASAVLLLIAASAWTLSADPAARALVYSLLTGTVLGIVLQRSRFCFLCNFRDFLNNRDPRGLIAIVVALAVGTLAYMAVTMAWVPVPQPGRLPPNAHIGPVGPVLFFAAFVFGIGMAISGSCLSAHFYRLGEGATASPFTLVGAGAGFYLGFLSWNTFFLASVSESRPYWLPHLIGYAGTVALTLALLGAILLVLVRFGRWTPEAPVQPGIAPFLQAVFVRRWPAVTAGTLIGLISALYFFRVAPLGVTAELGSIVRTVASGSGSLPDTLLGLDTLRGCATIIKQTIVSNNGLLVVGIVAGSFASALVAGQFKPSIPTSTQIVKNAIGGVLMGWGAMTALGCTVGVLLSGIHAGAVSGWVFLVACTLGVWVGLIAPKLVSRKAAA